MLVFSTIRMPVVGNSDDRAYDVVVSSEMYTSDCGLDVCIV
jgi:hypothetical protein